MFVRIRPLVVVAAERHLIEECGFSLDWSGWFRYKLLSQTEMKPKAIVFEK